MLALIFYLLIMSGVIEEYTLTSKYTHQVYKIDIRKPEAFRTDNSYTLVFVADGSYGVGRFLLDPANKIVVPSNCIIITIKHTGNKEKDRNLDFIPSDISKNGRNDYGQASLFYLFIKDELIPFVQHKFPNCRERDFIGHSLSGLFCIYLSFQQDHLFKHYYAISPS